jgi:alkylhydroperoxidase family enzyme
MERPSPRVKPLEPADWDPETFKALERWQPPMNFHKTMAHNPRTLSGWIDFGNHILFDNLMQVREREIVILRVAANLDCAYEWGAHRKFAIAQDALTAEAADRLAYPLDEADWTRREAALITAVDDIRRDGGIGDTAWSVLADEGFTPAWFIDLIYLVGEFVMVGTFMKSFRIALEDGFVPIPRG